MHRDVNEMLCLLRDARKRSGKTQQEVADEVGINQSQASRLERGLTTNPSLDTLADYARACGRRVTLVRVKE